MERKDLCDTLEDLTLALGAFRCDLPGNRKKLQKAQKTACDLADTLAVQAEDASPKDKKEQTAWTKSLYRAVDALGSAMDWLGDDTHVRICLKGAHLDVARVYDTVRRRERWWLV